MTFGHIFFIPLCIMIGMLLGFIMGARGARNAMDLEKKRDAEREKARAERAARKAAAAAAAATSGSDKPDSAA